MIRFSTDAASNDVAAPPILWVEGQPAGTVNNSAREMMAALAKWRDDNAGGLIANRGAGEVYSLATTQVFDAATLARPHTLSFLVAAENQGEISLSVDGLAPLPVLRPGGLGLGPRDLRPGLIYRVMRAATAAVYLLVSPSFAECGTINAFASPAVPDGWLPCDGRAVSRTAYAALFFRIGGYYGVGDGSTTFKLPDLRGRSPFGVDGGANRLTGAGGLNGGLGNAGGTETVQLTEAQLALHGHGGSTGGAGAHDHGGQAGLGGGHDHGGLTGQAGAHVHIGATSGAGGHSHTGTTDTGGTHSHGIGYVRQTNYRTDGASGGMNALNAGDGGTNTTGITDPNGTHSHGLTTSAVPDHSHSFTTGPSPEHVHTIAGASDHRHAIAGVGDHSHSLSIDAAGGGQAHSNMPPGLVVTFAIKA